MQIDLTQIILTVLTLIFALLMRYLIPVAKEKLSTDQLEVLRAAVKTGVYAAEQLYTSDQGKEKLKYVVDLLYQQGFIVNPSHVEDTTRALIEAMVKELKLEQAKVAAG